MSSLRRQRRERPSPILCAILLGAAVAACTAEPMQDPEQAHQLDERLARDIEVQIALMRHLIDEGGDSISGFDPARHVVCVELRGTVDASPFFRHFAERQPPVRPDDECMETPAGEAPLFHNVHVPSGRVARRYDIGAIDYEANDRAQTSVGYYGGTFTSGYWMCWLRKAETWFVVQCEGDPTPS